MSKVISRLTIGAATSGTGKTLFTSLLGRLLTKKGYKVQPFKCGPDYIDPSYHRAATGCGSRNLDTRLLSEEAVTELFTRQALKADISIIEGVMGLFDGADGLDERGSTSHLSKLLDSPVILLLDVSSTARSAGAVALGYRDFDPNLNIAGFILNRVASPRHEEMARTAIETRTGLPVLGALPRSENLRMPERHLGLVPAWETDEILRFLDANTGLLEKSIDLHRIIAAAESAPELAVHDPVIFRPAKTPAESVRIALALDRAFHFYYEDNLDLLSHIGAELVPFSPIEDSSLPEDISGIYIGGGYPELTAAALSENKTMLASVRAASASGMPIWAECGGLMYLSEGITDFNGESHDMAGVIPGRTVMKKGLQALGYYSGRLRFPSWMGNRGDIITGHVFHWSEMTSSDPALPYQLEAQKDSGSSAALEDGFWINRTWAGYMHIHFASHPGIADNFIKACLTYKAEQKGAKQ